MIEIPSFINFPQKYPQDIKIPAFRVITLIPGRVTLKSNLAPPASGFSQNRSW